MKNCAALVPVALAILLVGCSSKPVRHLAADAALLQPNVTTLAELPQYLGEPRESREVGPGVREYVYAENIESSLSRMPLVGKMAGSHGREMLIVTVQDDVVRNVVFRSFNENDRAWVKQDDRE